MRTGLEYQANLLTLCALNSYTHYASKCTTIYHFQTAELRNFLVRGLTPFPGDIPFNMPNLKTTHTYECTPFSHPLPHSKNPGYAYAQYCLFKRGVAYVTKSNSVRYFSPVQVVLFRLSSGLLVLTLSCWSHVWCNLLAYIRTINSGLDSVVIPRSRKQNKKLSYR